MTKKSAKKLVIIVVSILVVALYVFLLFLIRKNFLMPWQKLAQNQPNQNFLYKSPFFGKIPYLGPPIGIMIENEIMARPYQVGLSRADIVYEAPTEGNITRFLAVFLNDYAGKIGPVRSARSYFVDFIKEYGGIYAHVGGEAKTLVQLRGEKNILDVDQFFYEKYFWRENRGKVALEHTMFTTGEKLRELAEEKNIAAPQKQEIFPPDRQARGKKLENLENFPQATEIFIDFGLPSYKVQYIYDTARNLYLRSQANKPHIDSLNNEQIAAKTVVVQRVKTVNLGDYAGHISIKTVGKGDAYIFTNGRVIKALWQKESPETPTKFFTETGEKINLSKTPTWMEIVPEYDVLKYNFYGRGAGT